MVSVESLLYRGVKNYLQSHIVNEKHLVVMFASVYTEENVGFWKKKKMMSVTTVEHYFVNLFEILWFNKAP